VLDKVVESNIENHLKAIEKAASSINNFDDPQRKIYANDVTPITLLRRTNRIIDLSNELEDKKKDIFKRLSQYITLLNEFQDTKNFSLIDSKSGAGGIIISKDKKEIDITKLSSGEK